LSTVVTIEEVVPDFAKITLTPDKASLALSSTVPLMIAEPVEQQSGVTVTVKEVIARVLLAFPSESVTIIVQLE
jgi:hypothetical protein